MSQNQGESIDYNISNQLPFGKQGKKGNKYGIIAISRNVQIHQALGKTLEHFSMNGQGIHVFNASNLKEAQILAEQNPDVILVIIDNDIQVNGSYSVFVDYMRKTLGNKQCCVTFKDALINSTTCEADKELLKDENYSKFFNARERLIDVTRMVMITTEMESKITRNSNADSSLETGYTDTIEEPESFTKDKLNTVMAHELKEPVGNIKVMLDFLTNEPELLDKETSKDLLHRVRESANNIHEMLEDFLFWSRMFKQETHFNPGKVDIGRLARENVVLLKSTALEKKVQILSTVPEQIHVLADEYMITTVLRNLLYNAIKFTSEKGEITVSAIIRANEVEIRVKDTGIGIPEENLEKLFKSDEHLVTSGTEKETGSGLGLVLCKDFIERNGGTLGVESEENYGTTFIFTLPVWSYAELT